MLWSTCGGEAERRCAIPKDPIAVDDASALHLRTLGAREANHGAAKVRHLQFIEAEFLFLQLFHEKDSKCHIAQKAYDGQYIYNGSRL